MLLHTLSCFEGFRCIAGACPDTCCAGWEVDLDDRILEVYEAMPGPLGEAIRERLRTEDGYTFFALEQGRCPFLTEENLCRLILEQGDHCLSTTCREHPRFWTDYGDLRETCLSVSCPEAARLLLTEPFSVTEASNEEPSGEPFGEFDRLILRQLLDYRQGLFTLARCRRPFPERLGFIWASADQEQEQLELTEQLWTPGQEAWSVIGTITGQSELSHEEMEANLQRHYEALPAPGWEMPLRDFLREMLRMEFTRDDLKVLTTHLLNKKDALLLAPLEDAAYTGYAEKLLCYFLYRYVPRALWHLELTDKVRFSVMATGAILALTTQLEGSPLQRISQAATLFSREVEHSDENLDRLLELVYALRPEYS